MNKIVHRFGSIFLKYFIVSEVFTYRFEVFGCILGYRDTVCENWFKPSPNGPITQLLHIIQLISVILQSPYTVNY